MSKSGWSSARDPEITPVVPARLFWSLVDTRTSASSSPVPFVDTCASTIAAGFRDAKHADHNPTSARVKTWSLPRPLYAEGVTDKADWSAYDDDETDFWLSVPGIRESLIEAEADYAAGRTFNEEEIRTQFGLPPREADGSE
jgi:hypothetical protein